MKLRRRPGGRAKRSSRRRLLVIGDEILSGRTTDRNIHYIAEHLTARRHPPAGSARRRRRRGRDRRGGQRAARALRPICSPPAASARRTTTSPPTPSPRRWASTIDIDARAARTAAGVLREAARRGRRRRGCAWRAFPPAPRSSATRSRWRRASCSTNVIVLAGVPDVMQVMLDDVTPRLATGAQIADGDDQARARRGRCRRFVRRASKRVSRCCDGQLSVVQRGPHQHATRSALDRFCSVSRRRAESLERKLQSAGLR